MSARHPSEADRGALRFTVAIFVLSLVFQRFAVPFGGFPLGVVGPLGLALAMVGVLRGTLAFDRVRLCLFLALLGLLLLGAVANAAAGPRFGVSPSWPSVLHFVALTGFATLSFARPVAEERFFRLIVACFAATAVIALLHFVLQFAGIALFSFSDILPESVLLELLYNPRIPIGDTQLFKANGFLLLEPSILSQYMALGIIIEAVYFRRPAMLALLLAALLASVSGTGWLVLVAFVGGVVLSMGRRGMVIAIATAMGLALGLAAMSVVMPDAYDAFAGRVVEFNIMDTSGHLRFVTPFWVLQEVVARFPSALLVGIGAGVGERLPLPYNYSLNTPVKLVIEFGIPLAIAYVALFAVARRTQRQATLLLPGLVMLLFAGPYQQLAPVLFPVLLIMTVARLAPSPVLAARHVSRPGMAPGIHGVGVPAR